MQLTKVKKKVSVKTSDGGLRDKNWYYSWYEIDGDYKDVRDSNPNCSTKDDCNTYSYTNAVNVQGLCGAKDWRLPTKVELMKLVLCSDGKYNADDGKCTNIFSVTRPTINTTYFPDVTQKYPWFWSSTPYTGYSDGAWIVAFHGGYSEYYGKVDGSYIRLVRG